MYVVMYFVIFIQGLNSKYFIMKRFTITLLVCFILNLLTSCNYYGDNHNTSISFKESSHSYSMKAHFNKNKMRDVEEYMDNKIGKRSNMSFAKAQIDGKLALDDNTTFYIRKSPGNIEIKLDKDENSEDSYLEIKSLCQGIKKVIVR